jgi:Delta6-protoilludene synthase
VNGFFNSVSGLNDWVDLARIGCDLMNFFFVYDEYTDIGDASGATANANAVISSMKNPETKSDSSYFLGEMARQ